MAQSLSQAGAYIQYDETVKRLLSNKYVLATIMKGCLEEYQACTVEEIVQVYIEGMPQTGEVGVHPDTTNTNRRHPGKRGKDASSDIIHGASAEDAARTEGTVRYDVRFFASVPGEEGRLSLILNLEAQNQFYPGYPLIKRGIYYCARMISAQYGSVFTKAEYGQIKKVYSIWLCTHPVKSRRNTITRYVIRKEDMVGIADEERKNYDLMTVIMICLGEPGGENYGGILRFLEVLLSGKRTAKEKKEILSEEFNLPMTEELESEVQSMCNLSQGIWQDGIKEGLEQGLERGIQQGLERGMMLGEERGEINAKRETAHNLAEMGMAVEMIAKALKVNVPLIEEWLAEE